MVRGAVGAAVVGAAVGVAVVGAAVGDGLGVAVVGAAVRIWIVALGEGDAEGLALGDGDAEPPAKRERPPLRITPISSSVRRPPATAARIRSIQRGPRCCGGMILVVSLEGASCVMEAHIRTRRADPHPTFACLACLREALRSHGD